MDSKGPWAPWRPWAPQNTKEASEKLRWCCRCAPTVFVLHLWSHVEFLNFEHPPLEVPGNTYEPTRR